MGLPSQSIPPGDSRPVRSNQAGPHERLAECVRRHAEAPWKAPLHGPSQAAFERLEALRLELGAGRPIVLDAGCGTGESTRVLGRQYPEAVVVGVDRSAARLARTGADQTPTGEGNVLWCRAELESFWRLALAAGWPLHRHFLLYPNPWPKAAHLGRRWHGHPVFPSLLALGGLLDLRSNWRTYVEEFAAATAQLTGIEPVVKRLDSPAAPLSPFERKYAASGHALWHVSCELPITSK